MAEVTLDINGNFGDLFPNLNKLSGVMGALNQKNFALAASLTEGLTKGGASVAKFNDELVSSFQKTSAETESLKNNLQAVSEIKTATLTSELEKTRGEVEATTNATNNLADAVIKEAQASIKGNSAKEVALQKQVDLLIQLNQASKLGTTSSADATKLTTAIANTTKNVQTLTAEVKKSGGEITGSTSKSGQGFTSLIQLVREARNEAFLMGEQFGPDSPQAVAAQQNLANLSEKLSTLQNRIQALNPQEKFRVIGQLAQGIAGGFAAAQGAMALFGTKSEEVERALLKVQGALALSQGLNEVLKLGDTFKSLAAVLGVVSSGSKVAGAAVEETASHTIEATTATTAYSIEIAKAGKETLEHTKILKSAATGLDVGATAAKGFGAAFEAMLGPIVAITLGLTIVIALFDALRDKSEDAGDAFKRSVEILNRDFESQKKHNEFLSALRQEDIKQFESAEKAKVDALTKSLSQQQALLSDRQQKEITALKNHGATVEQLSDRVNAQAIEKQQLANSVKLQLDQASFNADKAISDRRKTLVTNQISDNEGLIKQTDRDIQALEDQFKRATAGAKEVHTGRFTIGADKELIEIIRTEGKNLSDADRRNLENQKKTDETSLLLRKADLINANTILSKQQETDNAKDLLDSESFQKQKTQTISEETIRRNDTLTQLQADFLNGLKQLTDRAAAAEIASAFGNERIDLEKKQQEKELQNFKEFLQLKGQAEINASTPKGQTPSTFAFNPEQQKALDAIQNNILQESAKKKIALELSIQKDTIDILGSGFEKENDLLLNDIKTKEKIWTEQGVSEIEIKKRTTKLLVDGQAKIEQEKITQQTEESNALIDAIKISGVNEAQAEKIRAELKLEAALLGAKKQREALLSTIGTGGDDDETLKQIKKLDGTIAVLKRQVSTAKRDLEGNPITWSKVFGIDSESADKFDAAMGEFFSSAGNLIDAAFQADQQRIQAHIDANNEAISSDEQRIQELQNTIDQDLELNKQGLANNLTLHQQQLNQLKAQRDKDIADQKALAAEKKKLAQEQAIVDAASVASQLILSTVNVIESLSALPFGIGVVLGLAAAGALVAGFLSIKSKVQAASLGEGGEVDGKPHAQGGNKYVRMDGNTSKIVEIESEEWLTKKKQARKHKTLLRAINNEDYNSLDLDELMPFLKPMRIALSKDISAPVTEGRMTLHQNEIHYHAQAMSENLEKEVRDMHTTIKNEVGAINEDLRSREKTFHDQNGKVRHVTKKGNTEFVILSNK